MLLVHLGKPEGATVSAGLAKESLAVAKVIGCVGQREFGVSMLKGLTGMLPLCCMSIDNLRVDQPELFYAAQACGRRIGRPKRFISTARAFT